MSIGSEQPKHLGNPDRIALMLVELKAQTSPRLIAELERSFALPEEFAIDLMAYARSRASGVMASREFSSYDFYHDLVVTHQGDSSAFSYETKPGLRAELSYNDLEKQVGALAAEYQHRGVLPGTTVAICLGFSLSYLLCTLALLRLGAVITPIDFQGPLYILQRLEAAGCEYCIGESADLKRVGAPGEHLPVRSTSGRDGAHLGSYSYLATDEVFRVVSPLSSEIELVSLTAHQTYLGLMRDRVLVFGLRFGERFAAPDFPAVQYQPQLALSVLAAGATYVHGSFEELREAEELKRLHVLGLRASQLSPELDVETFSPALRLWFRSVSEKLEFDAWGAFEGLMRAQRVAGLNLGSSNAFGGSYLWSSRSLDNNLMMVLPIAGEAWEFVDPNGSGQQSLSQSGVLVSGRDSDALALGEVFIGRHGSRFLYSGQLTPSRSGRGILKGEVESIFEKQKGVSRAILLDAPSETPNHAATILVAYCNPLLADQAAFSTQVIRSGSAEVEAELGAEQLPDRVEVFYGEPPVESPDELRQLSNEQYFSGALRWKTDHPVFLKLAQLRYIVGQM